MPTYTLGFFNAAEDGQAAAARIDVEFVQMAHSSVDITEMYRGFKDIPSTMFTLPTMFLGLFGHRLPKKVTMEDIRLHKLTNLSDDAHMVSLTVKKEIGSAWGRKKYITLDPTLFRAFLIDVHKTYLRHQLTFPGRMVSEAEHVALGVLFLSVKSITIDESEIKNPFYLAIDAENQEAIDAFQPIYQSYLSLLIQLNEAPMPKENANKMVSVFVDDYLSFYDKFAVRDNPMDKTVATLRKESPAFMTRFLENTSIDNQATTFRELVNTKKSHLLEEHAYGKTLTDPKPFESEKVVTCYDDPYSYSQYD